MEKQEKGGLAGLAGLFLGGLATYQAVKRVRRNEVFVACCVIPNRVQDFIDATEKNVRASREEDGNIIFDLHQSNDDRTRFVLHEVFQSKKAAKAHKETPHYREWKRTVDLWMAEPRKPIRKIPSGYRKIL